MALVAAALYAVVLAGNPLLHHDLACHQRTPNHCDACLSTSLASRVAEVTVPVPPPLPLSEPIEGARQRLPCSAFSSSSPGRSPPA